MFLFGISYQGAAERHAAKSWAYERCNKLFKRKEHSGNKSEISTGDLYRTDPILKSFTSSGENLTLAFSTDGIQPFQSSNSTLWSITCYVNELDASIKSEFIVLNALWQLKAFKAWFEYPHDSFVTDKKELYDTGISWTSKHGTKHETKVLALICICDSPAGCTVGYMKQYNGWNDCLHKGEMACKDGGDSNVMVYPIELPLPKNRTHADTLALAEKAALFFTSYQMLTLLMDLFLIASTVHGLVSESRFLIFGSLTQKSVFISATKLVKSMPSC